MDVCVELAKNLTARYWSTSLYDGVSPLNEYLAHNGVLVHRCYNPVLAPWQHDDWCLAKKHHDRQHHDVWNQHDARQTAPSSSSHWRGSWMQHSTTGPRIPGLEGDAAIGMVIDGRALTADDILCLYPLNGMSIRRSQQGCGPVVVQNRAARAWLYSRAFYTKIRWFGIMTKWEDISCTEFFTSFATGRSPDSSSSIVVPGFNLPVLRDQALSWGTFVSLAAALIGRDIVGHNPMCYDDSQPDFDMAEEAMEFILSYDGEPLIPAQWNENVDATKSIIEQHPTLLDGIWNEIVIAEPSSDQDLLDRVQAIFYVDPIDRERALALADTFGGVPVLQMDISPSAGALFECSWSSSSQLVVAGYDIDQLPQSIN